MTHLRFLLGFLALLAAIALQLWLVPFGVHADFAFAALVAFAFLFGIGELVAYVLFAVFVMNWQPGFSFDMFAFALIPIMVFLVQRRLHANLWIGGTVAVIASLLALYLVVAPAMIVSSFASFFLDIILCLAAGQIILWGMEERG
jgi:hypothetical protein